MLERDLQPALRFFAVFWRLAASSSEPDDRSVITYSAPSVPLAGTPRFHRMAAYTRCLRCAGAPRRAGAPDVLPVRCKVMPQRNYFRCRIH
jgi:hypothetical protein